MVPTDTTSSAESHFLMPKGLQLRVLIGVTGRVSTYYGPFSVRR